VHNLLYATDRCAGHPSINYQVAFERIVILDNVAHINSEGGDTTEIVLYCTWNTKYELW
jgi:hypothetical protein